MPNPYYNKLTPQDNQKEKDAAKNSKPYRSSAYTTWQYLRLSRAEQEQVNRECDKREREQREQK